MSAQNGINGVVVGIFCLFFASGVCSAELQISKNGLLKIDVPEGWEWVDRSDSVIISCEQEGAIIVKIQLQPGGIDLQDRTDGLLDKGIENMVQKVKQEKGILVARKSRTLDGLEARQVDFLLNTDDGKLHATFMAVFVKGYLFTVYMEASDEPRRKKMEKMIEQIRFLGR